MKKLIAVLGTVALMGIGATAAIASEGDAGIGEAVTTDCVTVIDVPEQTIHHDAVPPVTHVEVTAGQRYSWLPKGNPSTVTVPTESGSTPFNDPDHWQANTSNYNGTDPLGVAFFEGAGNQEVNGSYFFWSTQEITVVDVPGVDAYDEVIPAVTHEDCTTTTVDVCPNIADVQEEVPTGYALEDGKCIKEENAPPGTVQDTPTNGGPRVAPVKPTTQAPVLPDTE